MSRKEELHKIVDEFMGDEKVSRYTAAIYTGSMLAKRVTALILRDIKKDERLELKEALEIASVVVKGVAKTADEEYMPWRDIAKNLKATADYIETIEEDEDLFEEKDDGKD